MLGRIGVIMRKEIVQVLRDPRMRMLLFGPPLIQLIIFGYAVNLDVQNNELGWFDRDQTPASRALLEEFRGSTYFEVTKWLEREEEIAFHLDRGDVQAVVQVPAGFARDLARDRTGSVQVLIDGTDSNTASIVSSYVAEIAARFSSSMMDERRRDRLASATLRSGMPVNLALPRVDVRTRVWFNSNLESRNYFVPGVVVNIIGLVTVMLTAMAVVREKELGTMEQLMVSPIRPFELMLGKTLPFAAIGILQVFLVTGAALLVFGIPFRGSVLTLVVCSALFLLTTLGAGLLISTLSSTQQQAMMGSFFFFLPTFMLSGFTFPIRNMPESVQYLTYLNSVRYFIEVVRGIFLKGVGAEILWPQMLALLAIGIAMLTISVIRFHKRLD